MEPAIAIIMLVSQTSLSTQSRTNDKPDPTGITNGTIKVLHDIKMMIDLLNLYIAKLTKYTLGGNTALSDFDCKFGK